MKAFFRVLWIFLLIFIISTVVLTGCGDDDDDDDDGESIEQIITAIVEEMAEGQSMRTAEAYEQKVFVHVSENYDYAGFDKQMMMEDALEDLEDNPWYRFDDYELSVEVTVGDDKQTATAETVNQINSTMLAHDDQDFDMLVSATLNGVSNFVLDDDGEWRTVGGQAVFNTYVISGGDAAYAVDVSGMSIDAEALAAGGSVTVSGSLALPELAAGQSLYASVGMYWQDERYNAEEWTSDSESYYQIDVTDDAGGTVDFTVTLPDDGNPAGMAVPAALPLGADAVDVQFYLVTIDDDTGHALRADGISFNLPLEPLSNADPCAEALLDGLDGIWTVQLVNEGLGIWLFEILDLRVVDGNVYGSALYAAQSETPGEYVAAAIPLEGELVGNALTMEFVAEGITLTYEATISGTQMIDGTATFDMDPGGFATDFTGEKIDNRCVGLGLNELDGETLSLAVGGATTDWLLTTDDIESTLSRDDLGMEGYFVRNTLIALDPTTPGQWYALGFYDDEGGYAALIDSTTETVTEGVFSRAKPWT